MVVTPPPPFKLINHPKFYGRNLISSHKKRRNRWMDRIIITDIGLDVSELICIKEV